MADVSIRDLRNRGGDIVDRAEQGETITITRSGRPVASLRAVGRPPLAAEHLLARWKGLPTGDAERFRRDLDAVLDPSL